MAPVKCEQCGREFSGEHALKIHVGRLHKTKSKAKGVRKGAAAGKTTCPICGRKFKLPLHLGRHMAATHGKAGKAGKARKVKRARRVVARRAPRMPKGGLGADVSALSVDQLLGLKTAIDSRLADIARRMKQARVAV